MAHVSHELMSDEVIVMSSCTTAGEGQEEIFSIWDSHLFLLVCVIVQQDERNTVTGLSAAEEWVENVVGATRS